MGADPSLVFPGGRDAKEGVLKGPFHVREPSKNDTQPLQRRRHCLASQLLLGEVVWFGLVWLNWRGKSLPVLFPQQTHHFVFLAFVMV
jgi:hypothetical protein